MRLAFSGTVGEAISGQALDAPVQRTLWMSLEELRACAQRHRSPLVLQCIEDHAAGRLLPLERLVVHESLWQPQIKG